MAKGGSSSLNTKKGKVREALRNPVDVLNSLQSKACSENYYYQRLYRNLYNPEFYLLAYSQIYAKEGNMTMGTDNKTIDGMGMERINELIESLRNHSYQPKPARRVYIEKKNGKKRPLGIPSFDDKLVQAVIKMILESIYEQTFSNLSHGFRPGRSCHTALQQIQGSFTGSKWFIEGDIKGFFDNINHEVLITILRKRIKDEYFIALMWKFLKAGYLENWTYHKTYSGTPQGSLISPILSNVYLNELDKYMEEYIENYQAGKRRTRSEEYRHWEYKLKYLRYKKYPVTKPEKWNGLTDDEKSGVVKDIKAIRSKMMELPYGEAQDEGYRRLAYTRYADDWVCGVIGNKEDAIAIKEDIKCFLSEKLKLELSEEKTLITNAKNKARFLGFDIFTSNSVNHSKDKNGHTRRTQHMKIKLYVPRECWQKKLMDHKALKINYHKGEGYQEVFEPIHRTYLISNDDLEIIMQYNSEIRGIYNYYRIADNVSVLGHFNYVMKFSMYKTFGAKYKLHISQVRKKFGFKDFGVQYYTKTGPKICYFYNEGFKKDAKIIKSPNVDSIPYTYSNSNPASLVKRLKANECEWCGKDNTTIEIHHVRRLKDLKGKARWERLMIGRKRKTLALCPECHDKLHAGKLD
ncbi:Reverse-transcriptase / RNA maturase / DNA endonuclease [Petrocella atlantisensis]|uniref:Reverse-transcriptase / RNA maturase / DNA endonuclease n=1 Tax=Petrocella atlantisensis TaxID=2173034 RepID=A0A3P7PTF1_9FIRM|nr:Reverse-transcriptase / RNA maturase / DNA endonuclease [Petrocella atlantisensis]